MNDNAAIVNGMIDISDKEITKRVAVARSTIQMGKEAYQLLIAGKSPKGDVFETAKIAGILAAKSTSTLIPLCHPLSISKVKVTFKVDDVNFSVTCFVEVVCNGRTGVEMEALLGASSAALTIYDMMKWKDKSMVIVNTQLDFKSGGKSGDFKRAT